MKYRKVTATTMKKVPLEILREVLFMAVFLNSTFFLERDLEAILTPLRISHVCRTWRDLALSDGRLWSYLRIFHNYGVLCMSRRTKAIFDTWIARSDKAPLNYKVYFDTKRPRFRGQDEKECAAHIVTTLINERHRWQDVDFDFYWGWEYEFPFDIGPFGATSMPMLTSLNLGYKRQSRITLDLGQSSQLRVVNIIGNFSISDSKEPLRHLKEPSCLAFRDKYESEDVIRSCLNFMNVAPSLEELHIDFEHGLKLLPSPLNIDRPVYPGLRRLELRPSCGSDVLIDNVTLPSLVALDFPCSVSQFDTVDRSSCQKLLHFIERSLPPLTFLMIDTDVNTRFAFEDHAFEDSFIPCLKLLPTLEQLQVLNAPVSTRFFHGLTVTESATGTTVCPSLEALVFRSLECVGDSAACAEALISMLESRARIMATFNNVWFRGLKGYSTIHPSRLREYGQEAKELLLVSLRVSELRNPFVQHF